MQCCPWLPPLKLPVLLSALARSCSLGGGNAGSSELVAAEEGGEMGAHAGVREVNVEVHCMSAVIGNG